MFVPSCCFYIPHANDQIIDDNPCDETKMEFDNYLTLLPKFGSAIDDCLAAWETYLIEIENQPTYETIISASSLDTAAKVEALEHLLSTIPLRHANLMKFCSDSNLEHIELPEKCDVLLEELLSMKKQMDFDSWFSFLSKNKRFVDRVVDMEQGIKEEEMFRKQQLNRLKALHIGLMSVHGDGELMQKDVEHLVDAMEALGVSIVGVGILDGTGEVDGVRSLCDG